VARIVDNFSTAFHCKVAGWRPDEVNEFFSIYLILPAALGPGDLASDRNKFLKRKIVFLGSKVQPVRGADSLTAIFEPIVYTMWDP
jgi:hypothetical protein